MTTFFVIEDTNISAQIVDGDKNERRYLADETKPRFEGCFTTSIDEAKHFDTLEEARKVFKVVERDLTRCGCIHRITEEV